MTTLVETAMLGFDVVVDEGLSPPSMLRTSEAAAWALSVDDVVNVEEDVLGEEVLLIVGLAVESASEVIEPVIVNDNSGAWASGMKKFGEMLIAP